MNLSIKYFLIYIICINLTSFLFMYIDKKKAINHQYRISESTLLSLALLGGSFGTIAGMYKFRHKTQKIKFKIGVPFIIFIQVLIFCIF
ncbi:MAG: DUF1294 domain-containing protein [Romboutsia sp.]|uniref:DUF1294 domain-containing protein n=1 Tax=Romboutsia sp. TaxID=1965302 RepID=UPI003F4114C6